MLTKLHPCGFGEPFDAEAHERMSKTRIVWFARGGLIARMGPFDDQVEAAKATFRSDGTPVPDAFVWPERVER